MKLEVSEKTGFGKRPHIKKGYYPGKLRKVSVFSEQDGTPKVGKFGQQLIFEFDVYKADPENDKITQLLLKDGQPQPVMYKPQDTTEQTPVVLSKFVYHLYKKNDKNNKPIEGEFQTAITPNSAITKLLKALGWNFTSAGVDPDEFIGRWVELNIDDYTQGEGDEAYNASTIKDVGPYKGPSVSLNETEKTLKSMEEKLNNKPAEPTLKTSPEAKKIQAKIESLNKLHQEGFLTADGLRQSTEALITELEHLQ